MHAPAPARYVSVSELYSADEVELLLEEIRELEPTSCRGEDLQDFEIAGSGAASAGRGGRSPAGTERSWDSHAHYLRAPPPPPRPLAPVYCAPRVLITPSGAISFFILVCSVTASVCIWCGAGLRAGWLPGGGSLRLLQFAAVSSALLHAALLLVRLTSLTMLMPLPWDMLCVYLVAYSGVSLGAGGGCAALALLAPDYSRAPTLRALLAAAAGVSLCAALPALLVWSWLWRQSRRAPPAQPRAYRAVPTRDRAL